MESALIVFSQFRWDFVYHRRPQQLLSRLARHHPVVFIEEPVPHAEETFFHTYWPEPNVLVCQPHTPVMQSGFHDENLPHLQSLIRQVVRDYDDHIAWFYTPMALPLLQELHPRLVVYDCIDEAAIYGESSAQLPQREDALLNVADLVFAEGRSLHRVNQARHPNVHCVPSSVDPAHFLPALDRSNSHPAHKDIPGPRLGFYGVIDECFDTALLEKLADAHAMWQIVLVGQVVGIDPASLPQRANIHYLGPQPYQALPHFLAGWDVGLLPFAVNDATPCISTTTAITTALEYMAAELPIVSTAIPEIAERYGKVVAVAADARAFVSACEEALLAPPHAQRQLMEKMQEVVASTSWDLTVDKMRTLLKDAPRRRDQMQHTTIGNAVPKLNPLPPREQHRFAHTAIIGAGPTGLSAAYHLGHDVVLFERSDMVGGGCRPIKEKGFIFDHASHVMLSNDPQVLAMYDLLLGSNVRWQPCEIWVCRDKLTTRYALRDALQDLQPGMIMECIPSAGGTADEQDVRFAYPLRGGLQALMSAFVPHIKGTIELNAEAVALSPMRRLLTLADGRIYEYENLISTMPLPQLIRMIGDEAPDEVQHAAAGLGYMAARYVHLGVARANITDKHWIYYPEGTVFHRVFAQGNASPECNPAGGFGITCEIAYAPESRPLPADGDELRALCIRDCIACGLLRDDDRILVSRDVDVPYAYVMHSHAHERKVEIIKSWLAMHDIALAGRHGEHAAGHAFVAGKRAAEAIKWGQSKAVI
jgi:protoporphyrinogen oxidase/glycosyltransferase involved in cell wall biosynthesis